jgi:hypothetical protein
MDVVVDDFLKKQIVPLNTAVEVCNKYGVVFTIESNRSSHIYKFGSEVAWAVPRGSFLTYEILFEVVQHLAAKNPVVALGDYYGI